MNQIPSLVVHPHALLGDGRIMSVEPFLPRETVGAYARRTGIVLSAGPVVAWHNGIRVPDVLLAFESWLRKIIT